MPSKKKIEPEIGVTGLKRWGGIVDDEYRKELRGQKALKVFREMGDDPIIGACLLTLRQMIRQTPVIVEPGADERATMLVETCLHDMSQTWETTRAEQLSSLQYGWSASEIVYRRRDGQGSQYSDGLIGWHKMPPRAQESLYQWDFDESGGVQAMKQMAAPDYKIRTIPVEKLALFQTEPWKGSPEGRSLLSTAYLPWYFQRRIRVIEGIGIERDLAGIPKLFAPSEVVDENNATTRTTREALKRIGANLRADEQAYILIPSDRDGSGNRIYDVELLGTGSRRLFDTSEILQRQQRDMAAGLLCDFILLGHGQVGSFALADSKTSITGMAVKGWLNADLAVFNRHLIPRLLALNGLDTKNPPKLAAGDVNAPTLVELGDYIAKLAGAGFPLFPNPDLEDHLMSAAKLPGLNAAKREDVAAFSLMLNAAKNLQTVTKRIISESKPA